MNLVFVWVLGAIDEKDNQYLEIVGNGEITSKEIEESLSKKKYRWYYTNYRL